MSVRYRGTVSYEGTRYNGWQFQENGPSIQAELEKALEKIHHTLIRVGGAGRTDAGVHAIAQTFHFDAPGNVTPHQYFRAMNSLLPEDIAVGSVTIAPEGFDSRRDTRGKLYRYIIRNHPAPDAVGQRFHWHFDRSLDVDRMREAARHLLGEHDFRSFQGAKHDNPTSIRKMFWIDIQQRNPPEITIEVHATAFLKQMVRIIVGTLVFVGYGKLSPDDIPRILAAKDRTQAGPTAPAKGLFLVKVFYPDDPPPAFMRPPLPQTKEDV